MRVCWLSFYRGNAYLRSIVYSSPKGIAITGVGFYEPTDGDWIAPSNFTARWDDVGYNHPSRDLIGVLQQDPIHGRYGFPFHEACWSLLEKAYFPTPIPGKALFDVCRSLPFPLEGSGVNWGHDFGGLVLADNLNRYPWEDRFEDRARYSAPCLAARKDPYHVPEIQQLLHEDPQAPPALSSSEPVTTVDNCFSALPEELCIMIACNLPTVDALNTRRASRSFLPIFNSQQFWASRFEANADRAWLFESQEWGRTHWRWLYRRTHKAHLTGGMQNRERVWKLIQCIQGTLRLQWTGSPVLPSPSPNPANVRWLEATSDLRPEMYPGPYLGFNEGCRRFREQQTSIPISLSHVVFSVIQLGDAKYIAGMRLVSSQGEDIQLGYRTEGREFTLDITLLAGFNLAVGSRGIQGIQCITSDRQTSQWFGSTHMAPRTRRLAVSNPITAIKAGFDVSRLPPYPPLRMTLSIADTTL